MNKILVEIHIEDNESNIYFNEDNNSVLIVVNDMASYNKFVNNIKSSYDLEEKINFIKEFFSEDEEVYNNKLDEIMNFCNNLPDAELYFRECRIDKFNKNTLSILEDASKKFEYIDCSNCNIEELKSIIYDNNIDDSIVMFTKYNYLDCTHKKETRELIEYLLSIKNYIEYFNLSQLEICLFVYDLLREREYKYGNPSDLSSSRSLYYVYNSQEIVCAGFSKMYSAILELFGIYSTEMSFKNVDASKNGHMSNLIYLDDDKYDEHNIIAVDTTWGRIYDKDGKYNYKDSLKSYVHFGQSLADENFIKKRNGFEVKKDRNFSDNNILNLNYRFDRLKDLLDMGYPDFIIRDEIRLIIKCFDKINININNSNIKEKIIILNNLLNDYSLNEKNILKILNDIYKNIYINTIKYSSFVSALYHVKLVENSIDKDKYPFNDEIFNASLDSSTFMSTKENRILNTIFSDLPDNDSLELDSARMSLISTFHRIADDDINKNPVMPRK